jgi:hypothetical protein
LTCSLCRLPRLVIAARRRLQEQAAKERELALRAKAAAAAAGSGGVGLPAGSALAAARAGSMAGPGGSMMRRSASVAVHSAGLASSSAENARGRIAASGVAGGVGGEGLGLMSTSRSAAGESLMSGAVGGAFSAAAIPGVYMSKMALPSGLGGPQQQAATLLPAPQRNALSGPPLSSMVSGTGGRSSVVGFGGGRSGSVLSPGSFSARTGGAR